MYSIGRTNPPPRFPDQELRTLKSIVSLPGGRRTLRLDTSDDDDDDDDEDHDDDDDEW